MQIVIINNITVYLLYNATVTGHRNRKGYLN